MYQDKSKGPDEIEESEVAGYSKFAAASIFIALVPALLFCVWTLYGFLQTNLPVQVVNAPVVEKTSSAVKIPGYYFNQSDEDVTVRGAFLATDLSNWPWGGGPREVNVVEINCWKDTMQCLVGQARGHVSSSIYLHASSFLYTISSWDEDGISAVNKLKQISSCEHEGCVSTDKYLSIDFKTQKVTLDAESGFDTSDGGPPATAHYLLVGSQDFVESSWPVEPIDANLIMRPLPEEM